MGLEPVETAMSLRDRLGRPIAFAAGFLARNARAVLVDAVAITAWVVLLSVAFALTGWPLWGHTAAMVAGIVVYTLLRKPLDVPET